MFYKLIVNAAFLAIGYYIGKEVARQESRNKESNQESAQADSNGQVVENVAQVKATKNDV